MAVRSILVSDSKPSHHERFRCPARIRAVRRFHHRLINIISNVLFKVNTTKYTSICMNTPKYIIDVLEDMSTTQTAFQKAKEQCLKMVAKEISVRSQTGRSIEYELKDKTQIEALSDFPKSSSEYRYLDVKYKAKILKAQLSELFPNNKFSVTIERYSGGSSIDAYWTGPTIEHSQEKAIERLYQDRGQTDSMTDYFDYDNYCHIGEDHTQHAERRKTFPACNTCGNQQEVMAITTDGKNMCMYCVNQQRNTEGVGFTVLPKW